MMGTSCDREHFLPFALLITDWPQSGDSNRSADSGADSRHSLKCKRSPPSFWNLFTNKYIFYTAGPQWGSFEEGDTVSPKGLGCYPITLVAEQVAFFEESQIAAEQS